MEEGIQNEVNRVENPERNLSKATIERHSEANSGSAEEANSVRHSLPQFNKDGEETNEEPSNGQKSSPLLD